MTEKADSRLEPGTMLAHYKVQAQLGAGAMGTVYLAHDTALDRSVAVKVLHREISEDPDIVRRFEREARAAARVNHPNLTHVYFVGAEDDSRFFVMEHVPGKSLFQKVADDGPLELSRAIDVLVQAARGLAAAHAAEVIHRDVKPSNLMLLPNGTVKVADFGLAKSLTGDADATGAGRVMGTPRYMSPEQCRGETVGKSTDAYSLGLVAFFILTGEHAFEGESLGKVIHDQMSTPVRDIRGLRSELPPALQDVLGKLCAKKPGDRPSSMEEVEQLLETVRPRELELAPVMARGAALLVDSVAMSLVLVVVVSALGVVALAGEHHPTVLLMDLAWPIEIGLWGIFFLLQAGMEWKYGGSPGKLLFHTRVVRTDGTKPAPMTLALRFLVRFPLAGDVLTSPNWWGSSVELVGDVVFYILQLLVIAASLISYFVLKGRTVSDVLTRTRVAHHSVKSQSS